MGQRLCVCILEYLWAPIEFIDQLLIQEILIEDPDNNETEICYTDPGSADIVEEVHQRIQLLGVPPPVVVHAELYSVHDISVVLMFLITVLGVLQILMIISPTGLADLVEAQELLSLLQEAKQIHLVLGSMLLDSQRGFLKVFFEVVLSKAVVHRNMLLQHVELTVLEICHVLEVYPVLIHGEEDVVPQEGRQLCLISALDTFESMIFGITLDDVNLN